MIGKLALAAAFITGAVAQATAPQWGQCGGTGWTGPTVCPSGWTCTYSSAYYSQVTIPTTSIRLADADCMI